MSKDDKDSTLKKGFEQIKESISFMVFLLFFFFIMFVGKTCDDAENAACREQCGKIHTGTVAAEVQPYRGFYQEHMCYCYQEKGPPLEVFVPQKIVEKHEDAAGCCD